MKQHFPRGENVALIKNSEVRQHDALKDLASLANTFSHVSSLSGLI